MSNETEAPSRPISAEDALPPVQPPSAGFILQLFIVPAVIVSIIVVVWLMFNWIAQRGSNPTDYVKRLQRQNAERWQVAWNIAEALRNPLNGALKQDRKFAVELAAILKSEMQRGSQRDEDVNLRVFLCKALGEFEIDSGLPALLEAAQVGDSDKDVEVRRAAIEGMALLASNVSDAKLRTHSELNTVLLEAAADERSVIRSPAAYALGVLGSDQAFASLEGLLSDAYPDVRYNAATGLARHGRESCLGVLMEMLDPEAEAGIKVESEAAARDFKRTLIQVNALRAIDQLLDHDGPGDLARVRVAVQELLDADLEQGIQVQATDVLRQLDERSAR